MKCVVVVDMAEQNASTQSATAKASAAAAAVAANATTGDSNDAEMKGFLLKWTNYIKGYQRRWFVLSKGVLSYYRLVELRV